MAKRATGENDRKTAAQQKKVEERRLRQTQIEECEALSVQAASAHSVASDAQRRHAALADHAQAFYVEIDKLAKKQPNMPVTDLTVESINDIIRDAKALVQDDPHLDRIKEFIPAGNNPSQSDVVLKTKLVRSALGRGKQALASRATAQSISRQKADFLVYVLRFLIENGELPARDDVEAALGDREFLNQWFGDDDEFDLAYLDEVGVTQFISDIEGAGADGDSGASAQDE